MADQDKKSGSGIRWIIRLVVLVALAYFFHPIVLPPQGQAPASSSQDDYIIWKFMEPGNDDIYQELQAYRDGRNVITITRERGDPDLPEGGNWQPKPDKETGLIRFQKEDLIDAAKIERLFDLAIQAGVVGLTAMEPGAEGKLQITTHFGGKQETVTGPAFVPRAYDWNPNVWKQRIRWQRMSLLILDDNELKDLLSKKEITLVNE